MKQVRKILIYRTGNLGDIVCSMPAMVSVRETFSDAWVGLLTNKENTGNPDPGEILGGNDFLDEIISYEAIRRKDPSCAIKLLKKIRALDIDLLVYLPLPRTGSIRLIRDWLFFSLAGCKRMVGFKKPAPVKFAALADGRKDPVYQQEVDRLMSLLNPLSIDTQKVNFRLPIKDKDKESLNKIWSEYQLFGKNPIVAISPAGKFSAKLWDNENYVHVILALQQEFDAQIILVGGKKEEKCAQEILKKSNIRVINLVGKTTYMESAELLRRCDLLVSNDCGSAHLSAAVGTSVVGIYSSTDYPETWHPWGNIHTVLRDDTVSCRFCFKTECETKECVGNIAVEDVIESCRLYLFKKEVIEETKLT